MESNFYCPLFHGLETRFTLFVTVLATAIIFGMFHYVNMFTGASLYDTTFEVLHAMAAGFMYAALRLRIGAIWPVMLFHALWDFCLFDIDMLTSFITGAASAPSSPWVSAIVSIMPATIYGAFVYWRWFVQRDREGKR